MDAGVAVAIFGTIIAIIQVWLGFKKEKESNTWNLLSLLHDKENQIDRFKVPELVEKAMATPDGFETLNPEEKACLARTSGMFNLAGILAGKGRIDLDILMPIFAYGIHHSYDHLKAYREHREGLKGYPKEGWIHFERLADKAREYAASNNTDQREARRMAPRIERA